jgi:hypothetical protein
MGWKYSELERAVHVGMAIGGPDMPYEEAKRFFPQMPPSTWRMPTKRYAPVFREFPELAWEHVAKGMDLKGLTRRAKELRTKAGTPKSD